MMNKYLVALCMLLVCVTAFGQDNVITDSSEESAYVKLPKRYRFRVSFKDKKHNIYSVKRPGEFLSPKSLDRRKRLGKKVDKYDLPVSPSYLSYLRDKGYRVHNVSKWNNTAVVETSDSARVAELSALSFVRDVKCVWVSPDSMQVGRYASPFNVCAVFPGDSLNDRLDSLRRDEVCREEIQGDGPKYGRGETQAFMLGVERLHNEGWRGAGMTIAVIDGGFHNVDLVLPECRVLGMRNFVHPGYSVYCEPGDHGTMVLSCIGTNRPGVMVGTAPEAVFYLLESEDQNSEQIIEEDNWCAAAEYADSLGVDVITTSLGYYHFDRGMNNHTYAELDGKTSVCSRAASLAASRGMLVLNSAGNSGDEPWKKISFPADADNILTVGAVRRDSLNTNFSSLGDSYDGRVKPDVMAMGQSCSTIGSYGTYELVSGTSFSCPILAGAVTCLWQAFPNRTPEEIIEAVRQAGDNALTPNNVMGYGIPNMWRAYEILKSK